MTVHLVGTPADCADVLGVLARALEVLDFSPPILPVDEPGLVGQRVRVRVHRGPVGGDTAGAVGAGVA